MTSIAVLSDIHGNLPALEAVEADALARGCTGFANLGDIVSGPLWPRETADWLLARDWPTIAGNHERQLLTCPDSQMGASDAFAKRHCRDDQLRWLASLAAEMSLPGAWCTHARPGCDHEYFLETVEPGGARDATEPEIAERMGGRTDPLILHGHSHRQRVMTLSNGQRIANPGSVGLPAYADDRPHHHVMESGDPRARYLILRGGDVTLHAVEYDHSSAVARARANERPDWAMALATGRAA